MKFQEIVSPTMKEMFVKQIETMILSGKLKVGDKLPTEREMAEQMKVSRTITNAGLMELQNKGFVEVKPRQGTFIADYKRNGTLDVLVSIMRFNGGRLDKRTFDSLMDFRRMLMGESAFLAAQNRTEEDLALLEENLEMLSSCETADEAARLKLEHNYLVSTASGNVIYPIVLRSFDEINIQFNEMIYRKLGSSCAKEGVREIIDLLRRQKPEEAREYMLATTNARIDELEITYYE